MYDFEDFTLDGKENKTHGGLGVEPLSFSGCDSLTMVCRPLPV